MQLSANDVLIGSFIGQVLPSAVAARNGKKSFLRRIRPSTLLGVVHSTELDDELDRDLNATQRPDRFTSILLLLTGYIGQCRQPEPPVPPRSLSDFNLSLRRLRPAAE